MCVCVSFCWGLLDTVIKFYFWFCLNTIIYYSHFDLSLPDTSQIGFYFSSCRYGLIDWPVLKLLSSTVGSFCTVSVISDLDCMHMVRNVYAREVQKSLVNTCPNCAIRETFLSSPLTLPLCVEVVWRDLWPWVIFTNSLGLPHCVKGFVALIYIRKFFGITT